MIRRCIRTLFIMIIVGKLEKFMGGPTQPPQKRVHVTINKDNVIRLNDRCYGMLGKPPAVYLHFSRADSLIAIEPVHSHRMPAAFPVKQSGNNGWLISASPFCKHYNIRIDATERFVNPEQSRDGKMLLLKLTETVTTKNLRVKRK